MGQRGGGGSGQGRVLGVIEGPAGQELNLWAHLWCWEIDCRLSESASEKTYQVVSELGTWENTQLLIGFWNI